VRSEGTRIATSRSMKSAPASARVTPLVNRASAASRQNDRFALALERLRELGAGLEAGGGPLSSSPAPTRLIDALGQSLAEHVARAESFLRSVAASRRDLLPAVVDLRADHAALTQELAELRLSATDDARCDELPLRVRRLLARVASHRSAEAALLERAAEQDANGA